MPLALSDTEGEPESWPFLQTALGRVSHALYPTSIRFTGMCMTCNPHHRSKLFTVHAGNRSLLSPTADAASRPLRLGHLWRCAYSRPPNPDSVAAE